MPDYEISISENDIVTFTIRRKFVDIDDLPSITLETLVRGREIVEKAGTNWDYQEIRKQFSHQLSNGFQPENVNGAFIGFVKKKVSQIA